MKKNNKKDNLKQNTPKKTAPSNNYSEQFSSFGIEPPRIYRDDAPPRQTSSAKKTNTKTNKSKPATKQTQKQKRAKQNKKRKLKKTIRKIIYISLIIIALAVVVAILSLTVFFKIDTIKVTGNKYYNTKQITAVLPIEKDNNLFLSDTSAAEEKLEKNLPYIYDAQITRKFPSTIIVNINEVDTVFALKNKDNTYTLFDKDLKVIDDNVKQQPSKSILVTKASITTAVAGEKLQISNEQLQTDITNMAKAVANLKLSGEITQMYSKDINNNYMLYDNRILFKLGSTDNLEDKIYSALAATEKLNTTNPDAKGQMTIGDGKQIYFTESK